MAKTPTSETAAAAKPGRKPGPVTPPPRLDFSQPIWVVFYQAATRNVWQPFTDETEARKYAADIAQTGDHRVLLFPPQVTQFTKTPPAATAQDVTFGFGA